MRSVAAMIFIVSLASCNGFVGEASLQEPSPIAIVNPDYIVLRAVTKNPAAGTASARVDGQTLYFQPSDRILDLSHLDPRTAAVEDRSRSGGRYSISIATTPAGSKALHQWTAAHVRQQLGIFIDGRLIAAPVVLSPITDMIILPGDFTKSEAEAILARVRQGGAAAP